MHSARAKGVKSNIFQFPVDWIGVWLLDFAFRGFAFLQSARPQWTGGNWRQPRLRPNRDGPILGEGCCSASHNRRPGQSGATPIQMEFSRCDRAEGIRDRP